MGTLELIVLVMLVLWLTGAFLVPVGNAVHLLLVVILVLIVLRLVRSSS